jgi:hypothetical protein
MKRFLAPILGLILATTASAQDPDRIATQTRIAKQGATVTGDRGLFTVPGVETLNRGQFSAGVGWSNTDRTPRDIDVNSFPVFVSVGVHGRLTVTGTFETQRQVTARNLAQPGFNSALPFLNDRFVKGYGDTILSAKYRIQRRRDNIGGVSLRGFVKFGTADAAKGLGTGRTDVGADLIFTSLLPLNFLLNSTMAYTSTSDATEPRPIRIKDELRSGLGFAWPSSGLSLGNGGELQGIFEYATVTFVGAGSSNASRSVQNPSDIAAGVRFLMLDQGITLDAGYRTNTKFDFDFPGNTNRHGMTFSVSFTKPFRPPGANRFPVVVLESSSDEISVGGSATIAATGYDADNDSLTYSWSASAGQIAGTGEKATFNAAGLTPGRYTIRATAQDGRGGTATSLLDVTVK